MHPNTSSISLKHIDHFQLYKNCVELQVVYFLFLGLLCSGKHSASMA